jgi:Icc protein
MSLYRFLCISDSHLSADRQAEYFGGKPFLASEAVFARIADFDFPLDAILHCGDLVHARDAQAYPLWAELLSKTFLPFFAVVGNHDDRKSMRLLQSQSSQPDFFPGKDRYAYTQRFPDLEIHFLDSQKTSDAIAGEIDPEQIQELTLRLHNSTLPFLIFLHHPLWPVDCEWADKKMLLEDPLPLHTLLCLYQDRCLGVFSGHLHCSTSQTIDGITYTTLPSVFCDFDCLPHAQEAAAQASHSQGVHILTVDSHSRCTLLKRIECLE